VRRRVEASVDDLDEVLRSLRDTIFGLQRRLRGRGPREEILAACAGLSPPPELTFSGPVDGALPPERRGQQLDLLTAALSGAGHGQSRSGSASASAVIPVAP
jgi:hypothetical protein